MRAHAWLALGLLLGGCTLQYTDDNAAKDAKPRPDSSSTSASTQSSSTSGSTTGTTSTTTTTGTTDTTSNTTGISSTGQSTTTGTTGTTNNTTTTSGTIGGSTGTTDTSGTTGSTPGTYTQIASSAPDDLLSDIEQTAPGTFMVLDESADFLTWSSATNWVEVFQTSDQPPRFTVAPGGTAIWVADHSGSGGDAIVKLSISNGQVLETIGDRFSSGHLDGAFGTALFHGVNGVAVDSHGNLVVTEQDNNDIRYIDFTTTQVSTIAGSLSQQNGFADSNGGGGNAATFDAPTAVTIGGDGTIYVIDSTNCLVRAIEGSSPWNVTTLAGHSCCANATPTDNANPLLAQFCPMSGIASDNQGNVFVLDVVAEAVREINSSGVSTIAGSQGLEAPGGLRVTGSHQLSLVDGYDIWQVTY